MHLRAIPLLVAMCSLAACGGDDDGGDSDGAGGPDAREPEVDAAPDTDAAPPEPFVLTTTIGGEQAPLRWVAFQDGDGDWQEVSSDDGVYSIDLATGRWTIAYLCQFETSYQLSFFGGTMDELPALTRSCAAESAPATGTLEVEVTGLDADGEAVMAMGNGGALFTQESSTRSMELRVGTWDVPVAVQPNGTTITRFGLAVATITDGAITQIQLDAQDDTAPVTSFEATVTGDGAAGATVGASFVSEGGAQGPELRQPPAGRFATVPLSSLRPGDLHEVRATATADNANRVARRYLHEGADVELPLPAALAATVTTASTDPYLRLALDLEPVAGAQIYGLDASPFVLFGGGSSNNLDFHATPGWFGDDTSWTQPDLSDLPGWDDSWALPDGETILWAVDASSTSGTAFVLDYFERDAATNFLLPGDWDGDLVLRSSVLDILELRAEPSPPRDPASIR